MLDSLIISFIGVDGDDSSITVSKRPKDVSEVVLSDMEKSKSSQSSLLPAAEVKINGE